MRQMNFDTKIDEVSRKPQSHITQEDAREIQSTEVSPPGSRYARDVDRGLRVGPSINRPGLDQSLRRFGPSPIVTKPWVCRPLQEKLPSS